MGGTEFLMVKFWHICVPILFLAAAFFYFCMNGYTYISAALVFIAGLILVYHLGSKTVIRIVSLLTAVGLLYFLALEVLIISNSATDKDPARKYLIVLGAQVRGDSPSLSLLHRLEAALEYLNTYPDSTAIVSGGKGDGENISEAQCMAVWLTEHGIAEDRIIQENCSTSTIENLQNSWDIIRQEGGDADDMAILSSNYHLYRAKSMARKLGMDPAGVKGNVGYPIYTLGMFIREAFGVTHFWVFGN